MPLANNALRKSAALPPIATRLSLPEMACAVQHGFGGMGRYGELRCRGGTPLPRSGSVQRPKLSDPAHETQELQPGRDGRVRCSARFGDPNLILSEAIQPRATADPPRRRRMP